MRFRRKTISLLLTGAVLAGIFAGPPPASSRSRDAEKLERLLGDADFGANGAALVDRSFKAALQAGHRGRDALDLVEICLDGEFEAAQVARILSLYTQLGLASLPEEGFVSKVREGVAKRVPPAKIVAAAERHALMIRSAKQILDGLVLAGYDLERREKLQPAVVDALEAGKSEREVRRIIASALEAGESIGRIRRELLR